MPLAVWLLDAVLGDPDYRWHPIRLLGTLSLRCEHWLFDLGLTGYVDGLIHWLLVVGAALATWPVVYYVLAGWLGCLSNNLPPELFLLGFFDQDQPLQGSGVARHPLLRHRLAESTSIGLPANGWGCGGLELLKAAAVIAAALSPDPAHSSRK